MNHAKRVALGGPLGGALLILLACTVSACGSVREQKRDYAPSRASDNSMVVTVKGYKRVRQTDPSLCWAACLEQSLALQGIRVSQIELARRVHGKGAKPGDMTINSWSWHQMLSVDSYKGTDGKELWFRCDVDRNVLARKTMVRKLAWELDKGRIPLVALKEPGGGGHIYSALGPVWPAGTTKLTPSRISGFVLYDPRLGKGYIHDADAMVKKLSFMVYVTSYDSGLAAATKQMESALNH